MILSGPCVDDNNNKNDLNLGFGFQLKVAKGIPAGGILITVTGKNLAYIQNPQMYVYHNGKMFLSVS